MDHGTDSVPGLRISSRAEGGYVIAALSGELDIACAPALRDQLLGLLHPDVNRMVIDMSQVSYADASGLAVLVGTGRRAGLLGGFLRLAAPTPTVAKVMRITGLHRQLDVFRTVQAAIISTEGSRRQPDGKSDSMGGMGLADRRQAEPVAAKVPRQRLAADAGELRQAIAAVLQHADAWRDADPDRRFTRALHALARAYAGPSHVDLTQAAHALLAILARQPLTHSPAVAATASRLRRLLDSGHQPAIPDGVPAGAR
jgi:anti-anti-sigma factor